MAFRKPKGPSPELFRTIAEYTYDWETWVDEKGVPRWVNAAVERITGYAVDACLALPNYPVSLVHPEEREMVSAILDDAARGGSGNDVEFRIIHRDGRERWVAISWQSVVDEHGKKVGYRSSVRDIDERKLMERELQALRRHAESAVIARSELLANVSHELRSPAHCISGFAELLDTTSLDETQQRYVSILREQCSGMQRQVDDLLQLAALEAGGLTLERQPIDMRELMRSSVEALQPRAQAKNLQLSSESELSACWVEGDATRIQQILRNLVDNALKFTERGEVQVRLHAESLKHGVYHLRLSVTDTGIGMQLDEARRVLAPFEQADATTRRRFGGVGLGLAIVQRLVSHMGGRLDLNSTLGAGTCVNVHLPLVALDEVGRRKHVQKVSAGPLPGGRALVVDDSAPARELLSAMLSLSGFQCREAESGIEARNLASKHPFDLVFVDYQMPGEDGAEVATALRKLAQTQSHSHTMRIYLLTANLFAHEQLGKLASVDGVLGKPLSRAALLTLLSEVPDQAEPEAEQALVPGLLDPVVIEDLRALPGRDGGSVLPRLVSTTRSAQATQFQLLTTALAEQQWDAARVAAHAIAGHAAIVGARFVAQLARELEDDLRERTLSPSSAQKRALALSNAWTAAEVALTQLD